MIDFTADVYVMHSYKCNASILKEISSDPKIYERGNQKKIQKFTTKYMYSMYKKRLLENQKFQLVIYKYRNFRKENTLSFLFYGLHPFTKKKDHYHLGYA